MSKKKSILYYCKDIFGNFKECEKDSYFTNGVGGLNSSFKKNCDKINFYIVGYLCLDICEGCPIVLGIGQGCGNLVFSGISGNDGGSNSGGDGSGRGFCHHCGFGDGSERGAGDEEYKGY